MMPSLAAVDWSGVTRIMIACGLLLAAVVVLGGGLALLRRRLKEPDAGASGGEGQPWTMEDLARMREEGKLTEEEYEVMRATLVAAYRGESPPPRPMPPGLMEASAEEAKTEGWDWVDPDFDLKKPPEG